MTPTVTLEDYSVLDEFLAVFDRHAEALEPMPCVNVVENECPCWTEDELDGVADGGTIFCGGPSLGVSLLILGPDLVSGLHEDIATADESNGLPRTCSYQELKLGPGGAINRFFEITFEQFEACSASIQAQCADRGF